MTRSSASRCSSVVAKALSASEPSSRPVNTHVVQPDGVAGYGEPVDPVDVGRRVKGSVEDEAGLAASAADGVVAAPADEGVFAELAFESVDPGAPDKKVV